MKWIIPEFEPEIVQAEADEHWHGDTEKVATTSIKKLSVEGVIITSRYQKAHELKLMAAVISKMPRTERLQIKSVFCDSKACSTYSLETTSKAAAKAFAHLMTVLGGGYNGISTDDERVYFDSYWTDDNAGE